MNLPMIVFAAAALMLTVAAPAQADHPSPYYCSPDEEDPQVQQLACGTSSNVAQFAWCFATHGIVSWADDCA